MMQQQQQQQQQQQGPLSKPSAEAGCFSVTKLSPVCQGVKMSCGLTNLGNTCYMSSVLQCLAALPPLKYAIRNSLDLHGFAPPCPLKAKNMACTCCLMQNQMVQQLVPPCSQSIRPLGILQFLHLFSKTLSKTRQEDAHEFLLAVLDAVERDTKKGITTRGGRKSQRTLIEQLFCGQVRSQVKCLSCGHNSNTYEITTTLSLDLQKVQTVEESLAQFTAPEFLDGANKYKCDRCKRLVRARKGFTLHDEPNILVVHLKRFSALSLNKISRHIGFKTRMTLAPFSSAHEADNGVGSNGAGNSAHAQHQQHQHGTYKLTGVLVHQGGSLHSGHYYAHVWDEQRQCWQCANDSFIQPVSLQEVLSDQAYMLFYTRLPELKVPAAVPGTAPEDGPVAHPQPQPAIAGHANGNDLGAIQQQQHQPRFIGPQLPPNLNPPKSQPSPAMTSYSSESAQQAGRPFIGPQLPPAAATHGNGVHSGAAAAAPYSNGGPTSSHYGGKVPAPCSDISSASTSTSLGTSLIQNGENGNPPAHANGSSSFSSTAPPPPSAGITRVGGTTVLGPKSSRRTVLPPLRAIPRVQPPPQQQQQQQQQPQHQQQQQQQQSHAPLGYTSGASSLYGDLPQPLHESQPCANAMPSSLPVGHAHSVGHAQPGIQSSSIGEHGMRKRAREEASGNEQQLRQQRQQQQQQDGSGREDGGGSDGCPGVDSGSEGDGRPQKASRFSRAVTRLKEDLYQSLRACPDYMAALTSAIKDMHSKQFSREQVESRKGAVIRSTGHLVPASKKQGGLHALWAAYGEDSPS